ncbi:hypothetical protein E2562_032984 [Oryza meyeriana var. granulata]|uniref:Uncharacterized protein n=1 Tax=Oryza meyeriana var. granulata TaxID=110450 RepID=A0A6G1CVK9_9ORYZ|nr:hypothetical protein E2562_032984 [Oryza meyeriana var. granulata]
MGMVNRAHEETEMTDRGSEKMGMVETSQVAGGSGDHPGQEQRWWRLRRWDNKKTSCKTGANG